MQINIYLFVRLSVYLSISRYLVISVYLWSNILSVFIHLFHCFKWCDYLFMYLLSLFDDFRRKQIIQDW